MSTNLMLANLRSCLLAAVFTAAAGAHAAEPVATVRVAFDLKSVTATSVQGMADLATGRRINADDPVRIASISKLVTAIGVMRLVEAGKLDLDADVSGLLGRPLRHPAWQDTPITLRLLLSHRSSLTDAAGYYAVPLDGALQDVLDDPRAWDSAHAPGTFFRYDREAGVGVAYFATGMPDAAPGKQSAFTAIEEQLARGDTPRK